MYEERDANNSKSCGGKGNEGNGRSFAGKQELEFLQNNGGIVSLVDEGHGFEDLVR